MKSLLYAVEETSDYCDSMRINEWHQKLIRWGRMEGIAVISLTQRCANLHKDILANSNHVFIFRTNITGDKLYLRGWLPREAVDAISQLKKYEFIYYNQFTGEWYIHQPIELS